MLRKVALFLTYLFQPLLMVTFGIICISFLDVYTAVILDSKARNFIIIVTFICSFILPGLGAFWLKRNGYISSLHVEKKEERKYPIGLTFLFYIMLWYFFMQIDEIQLIRKFLYGVMLSLVLGFSINFFYKISQHLIGMGGVLAIFTVILFPHHPYYFFLYIWIGLILILSWSRLYLKAHTFLQIFLGLFVGFLSVYVMTLN